MQSRVQSWAGSSHPCHMILRKCSYPHIWTAIYLIRRPRRCHFCRHCNHPFCCFCFLFPPLEMGSTLVFYTRFCCVHLGNEGHHSSSAFACLSGTKTLEVAEWYVWYFLGGGWPDDALFSCVSGDSPPLVIISYLMVLDGLKIFWWCGRRWWCSRLRQGISISRGRHPGAPVDFFLTQRHHGAAHCYFALAAIVVPRRWALATTRPQR